MNEFLSWYHASPFLDDLALLCFYVNLFILPMLLGAYVMERKPRRRNRYIDRSER
jgi:hypothetical protein